MRRVTLDAVLPATPAETVFDQVVQFDRYPALAPHVQSAQVLATLPEPTGRSRWELHFRSGLLRWTETEQFRRDQLRIEFAQTTGDFDTFAGHWQLRADGADTALHFEADFDFGIDSLAGILDPIAERVIRETVAWVVVGMFPQARLDAAAAPVPPAPGGARAGAPVPSPPGAGRAPESPQR
ncbi:MAG TPA: SRPBCC family protein [Pilimelia sp.]|nr:SRPBCC family protein [Pilimelia sp.]